MMPYRSNTTDLNLVYLELENKNKQKLSLKQKIYFLYCKTNKKTLAPLRMVIGLYKGNF